MRRCEARAKDPVRSICQELWDTGLRVSPTTRTIDDCGRFDQDNVEFTISLLDCRFLIGDEKLFARLHDKSVPQLVARESGILVQRLTEVTNTRHVKYGKTIFHLEPNLKDGPGGLRDFHVTRWIALITALEADRAWPESLQLQQNSDDDDVLEAMEFLSSARCYLHYRSNRDENVVYLGGSGRPREPRHWQRHGPRLPRRSGCDCTSGTPRRSTATPLSCWTRPRAIRSNLVRSFRRWRSRASNDEFSVVDRRVYIQQSAGARDPEVVLRLFVFMARHGVKLAMETERRLNNARRAPSRHHAAGCTGCGRICASCWCSHTPPKRCAPAFSTAAGAGASRVRDHRLAGTA